MFERVRRRAAAIACLSFALALALSLLAFSGGERARAVEAENTYEPPTVVRELVELRSENAKVFELTGGARRAEVYEAPIHFKDAAGQWRDIDTGLTLTGSLGNYRSAATPVEVTITSEAPGRAPVALSYGGAQVSFNLDGGIEGSAFVLSNKAVYSGVAAATTLSYQVLDDGLKETLTLAAVSAPNSFTFTVTHPGLELRQDATGQWGFYRPGKSTPLLVMSPLLVYDSSQNEAGDPAYCEAATMSVKTTNGASSLAYTVPRRWLDDPSRVYPVQIDPSVSRSASADTYIASAYPAAAYGSEDDVHVGYYDSSTGWNRGLFKFSLPSDLSGAYVSAAHLKLYQWWQYYASQAMTTHIGQLNESWSESSTWNSLGTLDFSSLGTDSVARGAWLDYSCPGTVQDWAAGTANNGFVVYQNSGEGQGYWRKFRSSEYSDSDYRPRLTIDYESPSQDVSGYASAYRIGDTVTATVKVNTAYQDDVRRQMLIVNYDNGNPRRGYLGWFHDPDDLPGGWVAVTRTPALPEGSVFAYKSDAAYGNGFITPDWNASSIGWTSTYHRATFTFTINDDFGDVQNNDFDTRYYMGPTASYSFDPGWINQDTNVCIYPEPVESLSSTTEGSSWFTEVDANSDGFADAGNDSTGTGRGEVTLSWPAAARADGYQVYLSDGGNYRPVGRTQGNDATSWSSGDLGFYPRDSEIAAASWPGAAAGNPFYRAATPAQASQLGNPLSPSVGASTGVVATDGSSLYVRRWGSQATPVRWKKIDSANGNVLATIGAADLPGDALSGFYHGGYLYSGYITGVTSGNGLLDRTNVATGAESTLTLAPAPLARSTGSAVTAASGSILLASDGQQIYSVSYMEDGTYNGYKVRVYDMTGARVGTSDHVIAMTSEYIDGVLADGEHLYLMQWTAGAESAHITKVSTSTWQVVNQWSIDQGATRAIGGCYDAANDLFWLGAYDQAKLYKYAGIGGGRDLRDNPNTLYQKTAPSGELGAATFYRFCVVPYSDAGELAAPAAAENPKQFVTLDNRTEHVREAPQHGYYELDTWAGHASRVVLDEGSYATTVTDLAIASFGPHAALERTYSSSRTTTGSYAPGWWFAFERRLEPVSGTLATATQIDYRSETGEAYRFAKSGSTWQAPNGLVATLASGSSPAWTLTLKDRSLLAFDTSGRLLGESDASGNAVTYSWSGSTLSTITAANGQTIALTWSGSRLASATYAVTIGGQQVARTVQFGAPSGSPVVWPVTYFPGSDSEYAVRYTYSGADRLQKLTVPDWDKQGEGHDASLEFVTGTNPDLVVRFPDWDTTAKPDARAEFAFSSGAATVTRYGRVLDVPNTAIHEDYTLNPSGTIASRHNPTSANDASGENELWSYRYAGDNQPTVEIDPLSCGRANFFDARGNLVRAEDQLGNATSYAYTDDLPVSETSPLGSVTTRGYDAAGRQAWQEQTLNEAGERSRSEFSYDTVSVGGSNFAGALVEERQKISSTEWATTEYGAFFANGEPGTTTLLDVKLAHDDNNPVDATTTLAYDAFGNLLSETDATAIVTHTDAFDLAGRVATSADASGVVAHRAYDRLGNETARWATSQATGAMRANYVTIASDPIGRALLETGWLTTPENPTGSADHTVATTYDGRGLSCASDSSTKGGHPAKWIHDACGNAVMDWVDACLHQDYREADASQYTFDALSRLVAELEPGDTIPKATEYSPTGAVSLMQTLGQSSSSYVHDAQGSVVREIVTGDGAMTRSYELDLVGRIVATSTVEDGQTTATEHTYDLSGREMSSTDTDGTKTTTYNTAGSPLSSASSQGTATWVYDASGRTLTETSPDGATTTTFDDHGRIESTRGQDESGETVAYDVFGEVAEEWTYTAGESAAGHTRTYRDSLGRTVRTEDLGSNVADNWGTVSRDGTNRTVHTISYDLTATPSIRTVISPDSRGIETQRVTTVSTGESTMEIALTVPAGTGRDDDLNPLHSELQIDEGDELLRCATYAGEGLPLRQWGAGFENGTPNGQTGAQNEDAYDYDASGRKILEKLQLEEVGAGGPGAIEAAYSYNTSGLLESYEDVVAGTTTTYEYEDSALSLVEPDAGVPIGLNYESGPAAMPLLTSSENAQTSQTLQVYTNDTEGRRAFQGPPSDADAIIYTYNDADQLVAFESTLSGSAASATYSYNGQGQRTGSAVETGADTTTSSYQYEEDRLLSVSATSGAESWSFNYLYDEVDKLYAAIYREGAGSPVAFAIITNDRGDVLQLLDADGNAFAAYRYDALGKRTEAVAAATASIAQGLADDIAARQRLGYAARCLDPESGLSYSPESGYTDVLTAQTLVPARVGDGPRYWDVRDWLPYAKSTNYARYEWPAGSGRLFENYDWYSRPEMHGYYLNGSPRYYWDQWSLDEPTTLIVWSQTKQVTVKALDRLFESEFGYNNWGADAAIAAKGATYGRMIVQASPGRGIESSWTHSTLKWKASFDADSFYHVRFYAPLNSDKTQRKYSWYGPLPSSSTRANQTWVIGNTHLDINELYTRKNGWGMWPGRSKYGAPPAVYNSSGMQVNYSSNSDSWWLYKFGGNAARVQSDIIKRWKDEYATETSNYVSHRAKKVAVQAPGVYRWSDLNRLTGDIETAYGTASPRMGAVDEYQGIWRRYDGYLVRLTVPRAATGF